MRHEARLRPTCEQLLATEALLSRARPMALLCPLRALAARHTAPPSAAAAATTTAATTAAATTAATTVGAAGHAGAAAAPDGTARAGAADAAAPLPLAITRPAPLGQSTLGTCAGAVGGGGGDLGGGVGPAAVGAVVADAARRPSASNLDPDEIEQACGAWAAQRAALAVQEAEAGGLDRTVSLLAGRPMLVRS